MQTTHFSPALPHKLRQLISITVRVITLPPFMAGLAVLLLHRACGLFPGPALGAALFMLTLLPLLPYPICLLIPSLRYRGRFIQRGMAVAFSVAGYLAGTVYCLCRGLTGAELTIFLSYLFSGIIIAVLSGCFHFKCSGHASGLAGPLTLLCLRVSPLFLMGYGLLIPVFISSLQLKRHTKEELMAGALTPSAILLLLTPLLGA